jgi:hypothetical protein
MDRPEPTTAEIDKAAEWCTDEEKGTRGFICKGCPLRFNGECREAFARAYLAARKEIEALADLAEERRG